MDEREKARFWTKAQQTETCWVWTHGLDPKGYGLFAHKGKTVRAHRAAYELVNGEIPEDLYVCHTCDNRKCINPDHLWVGTQKDNVVDAIKKKKFRLGRYSKYTGVRYRTESKRDTSKKWVAYKCICRTKNRKQINIHIGSFLTEMEAAKAVDKYKVEVMGINYGLNFPEDYN